MAERSKALVLGTSPPGRGFESHFRQLFDFFHNFLFPPKFYFVSQIFLFPSEYLQKLPIISYQGEDAMNVYRAPLDIIVKTVGKFDRVKLNHYSFRDLF